MRYEDQQLFQEAIDYYVNSQDAIALAISFESNISMKEILSTFIKTLNSRIDDLKNKIIMKLRNKEDQYQSINYCPSPKRMKLNVSNDITSSIDESNSFELNKFKDLNVKSSKYPRNEEVIGLEDAKKVLMEAIVLPRRFPDMFKACMLQYSIISIENLNFLLAFRKPWSKILLFGVGLS